MKRQYNSEAQNWRLKVICKNKKYLDAVVSAILDHGVIDFKVKNTDVTNTGDDFDGRYVVTMDCAWFNNLKSIAKDLAKIEKKYDKPHSI